MSRRARTWLFLIAAGGVAALLAWALAGLPDFGHYQGEYGRVLAEIAVPKRSATEIVGITVFDFRALDTLGEEFILFCAAVAVAVLLRGQRGEEPHPEQRRPVTSAALRLLGFASLAPLTLLGIYVVAHGHLTPGGGFQGGVILAAGLLTFFVAGHYLALRRVEPVPAAELAEAAGAAGFALVGVGGLVFGTSFLANFLPDGDTGLLTGGTVPVGNVAVGLEVAGAVVVILAEFLEQRLLTGEGAGG
jgi:multicomponent Na+:H+ antiporter subunit B